MKQVKPFSERLSKFAKGTVFAESTYDDFWGTGLDKRQKRHRPYTRGKMAGKKSPRTNHSESCGCSEMPSAVLVVSQNCVEKPKETG